MYAALYARLIGRYFLLFIIIIALLQTLKLAVEYSSESWERIQGIREHYKVYSKFSMVDVRQMVPISERPDLRGTFECHQTSADIIMIGVPKCGTGSVRSSLSEHPEIAMDMNSEGVRFFSTRFERGKLWYISQMPCSESGQLTAENSVQYFINEEAPARIANFNPDIKLVLTVRNPIDRLVSEFVQMQIGRPQYLLGETFEDNVCDKETGKVLDNDIVTKSLYSVHLKRWLQHFKMNQIHVINGDAFVDDPVSELKQLETFLSLESYFDYSQFAFVEERGFFCFQRSDHVECLEAGKGRKHPDINRETIEKLKEYFRPYNNEFIELIGRDFHWNN